MGLRFWFLGWASGEVLVGLPGALLVTEKFASSDLGFGIYSVCAEPSNLKPKPYTIWELINVVLCRPQKFAALEYVYIYIPKVTLGVNPSSSDGYDKGLLQVN